MTNQEAPTCAESETTSPQKLEQRTPPQEQVRQRRLGPALSLFHRTIRDVWFYVAAVSLVLNIIHTFRPELSVEIGGTIRNQPAQTLFTLKNTGSWTLYNVSTTCYIWTGTKWIVSERNIVTHSKTSAIAGNPDIISLSPKGVATRDCAVPPFIPIPANDSVRIDIDFKFDWFLGHGNATRHFDMRSFGDNFILVPDVEFRPDLPPRPSF